MSSFANRTRVVYWLVKATWHRHRRRIILLVLASVLLIPLGLLLIRMFGHNARSSTVGIVGQTLLSDIPGEIADHISFGLTRISQDGLPQPALAESWEATEGGKVYTFRLHKGLYWHDGIPVYADNIPLTLANTQVSYPDSYTIRIRLSEPFSPFLNTVSKPLLRGNGMIGMGTYKIVSVDLDESKRMKKLTLGRVNESEQIVYKFFENEKAAITALRMGEVDVLGSPIPLSIQPTSVIALESPVTYRNVVALLFNTKSSLFEEKATRQGLGYLLNLERYGEIAHGPMPPSLWAHNSDVRQVRNNVDLGKRLLEKRASMVSKQAIVLSTSGQLNEVAQDIAQQWKTHGLKVEVKVQRTLPQDFQVHLTTLEIPKGGDQYAMWHSSQTTNVTKYDNKRVDKLLEDARHTQDLEEQKKKYADFQKYLVDDAPALFLYYPRYYIYYNRKVTKERALVLKDRSIR